MTFNWYKIINKAEFEADDIPSREVELNLEGVGVVTVRVLKGELVSLVYDGVQVAAGLLDQNPFNFGGYAAYLDADDDLWLGIEIVE